MAESDSTTDLRESLGSFTSVSDEPGLSLNDLTGSLAHLLNKGADPYTEGAPPETDYRDTGSQAEPSVPGGAEARATAKPADPCPVTPTTIVEAVLFVGHPENEPLTAAQIAALMRGVRVEEVDALVEELNCAYREEGCPYEIEAAGLGYRMRLLPEFNGVRENFYGRVREARLSQAAIDVLAIVAYHQPVTRADVDALRRENSARMLNQLVRRGLLRVERPESTPKSVRYHTTDRFLEFLGLESLQELPQSLDFDRI